MAMPVRPTLGELRDSLLRRCGLATGGSAPASVIPVIDERLRQAERMLHTRMEFTHLWESRLVPLTTGVAEYDWPDQVEVGDLIRVCVLRDDGMEFELGRGLRPNERNAAYPKPTTDPSSWSTPVNYTIQDRVIKIGPAPDERWTQMLYEYYLAPGKLVDPEDRCAVDPEALLMQAEIGVKQHFGMPGTEAIERQMREYLVDLQGKQGDGDGLQLGGRQSVRLLPQIRNRVLDGQWGQGRFLSASDGRHIW